ncbi:U6 snRNA phosphodiesterase isoform X3 [Carya illinoinensis]|uniref:U6 snRNA phosphodiesterase isoform X3 n=1 Tax=Carya illinoinensis TaxID=32201 RepID=UPI001C71B193|nr:U6 snRNA phosphodiesterase isoform X3 [Carya illinoinensis]
MEALQASYGGDASSDSDADDTTPVPTNFKESPTPLPPPPLFLLNPSNSTPVGTMDCLQAGQAARVRSFPHVEGNYALHVYIPVFEFDYPVLEREKVVQTILYEDDHKLEQVALGREFHISLGRTVPIRVHQIDSVVAMLRQKLQFQKRYWIDFSKWQVFVNDDHTRTFLSMEVVTGGLAEIRKQIHSVNEVYKLHNLPEFYKDPRPHISLTWALGDISDSLERVVEEEMKRFNVGSSLHKRIFTSKFGGIECKIGNKTYKICKFQDE